MEASKKSLAGGKVAREEKKEPAPARKMEKVFSFAEFKTLVDAAKLDVPEESLRKSYQGLDQLRKKKNLSWEETREKAHALGNGLGLQVDLLKNRGQLKAARIPVTDRDWEKKPNLIQGEVSSI